MKPCPACGSFNYSDLALCSSCGQWIGWALAGPTLEMSRRWAEKTEREIIFGAPSPKASRISLDNHPYPRYIATTQNGPDLVKQKLASLRWLADYNSQCLKSAERCLRLGDTEGVWDWFSLAKHAFDSYGQK